jgi:hypothetical protein
MAQSVNQVMDIKDTTSQAMKSDRRNHLEHNDGLIFQPVDWKALTSPSLPRTVSILRYDGTEESFTEICKALRTDALKCSAD